jgi:hypothetical protein
MPVSEPTEDRLSRKRSKLEAALKELRERERERIMKKHAIVGRAVLARADRDPSFRDNLMSVLDAELTKGSERELFGLAAGSGARGRGRRRKAETIGETGTGEPPPATNEVQG